MAGVKMGIGTSMYACIDPFNLLYGTVRKAVYKNRKYLTGVVLDAGCGTSPYKKFIRCRKYIGMDIKGRVDLRASIVDIPLKSGTIDSVLCTEVLEHVNEPTKALGELNRVLKKGGYLLLTTPFMVGVHGEPSDYYRYTRYGLRHLLRSNGFGIVSLDETSGSLQTVFIAVNNCLHKTFVGMRRLRFVLGLPLVAAWLAFSLAGRVNLGRGRDSLGYVCVARKIGKPKPVRAF